MATISRSWHKCGDFSHLPVQDRITQALQLVLHATATASPSSIGGWIQKRASDQPAVRTFVQRWAMIPPKLACSGKMRQRAPKELQYTLKIPAPAPALALASCNTHIIHKCCHSHCRSWRGSAVSAFVSVSAVSL
ncbi:uncharacterized protein LOC116654774 [Drosophila ananassae]|uniref:uncharacterized protein LOC116654774 n=1 Tax=Drosophila ananassae TaxID=7217 RepID=UPI001CFF6AE1|nr:uncharacterized protein LOC116654774 [Drosophila ananassae]